MSDEIAKALAEQAKNQIRLMELKPMEFDDNPPGYKFNKLTGMSEASRQSVFVELKGMPSICWNTKSATTLKCGLVWDPNGANHTFPRLGGNGSKGGFAAFAIIEFEILFIIRKWSS